jgi:hypothetical protein
MKKITITGLLIALCLSILTGCSNNDEELIAYVKDNYQTNKNVTYEEPVVLLEQDHAFSFNYSEEALDKMRDDGYDRDAVLEVYIDDALRIPVTTDIDWEDTTATITPATSSSSFTYLNEDYDFSQRNEWGLYNHYYLVQYYDLESGKRLKKPIVTVFTVDAPLETPKMKVKAEDDNSYTFSWDEVSNADEYYLMRVDFDHSGDPSFTVIADTKDTSWNSKKDGKYITNVNSEIFKAFNNAKDEQYASDSTNWCEYGDVAALGSTFGVIAKDGNTFSSMSNLDPTKTNREDIVCQTATLAFSESNIASTLETIEQIPYQLPATSCDGNTINAEVRLDTKNMTIEADGLHIPYNLQNDSVYSEFVITTYNLDTYEKDVENKNKSISDTYKKETSHIYTYQSTKAVAFDVKESNTMPDVKDSMYGTTDLETFITPNMIDGAALIDISNFDDYSSDYIYDLLEQIITQNPIILKANDYYFDTNEDKIYIQYYTNRTLQQQTQQSIRDEVTRITSEIITPEMSDVDKVYAINQYICDITAYDYPASEADDDTRSKDYYYANTVEGVFLRKSAVCEGYAAAFMLLADAAGLDSIMVTGYPSDAPDVRHAWNRVLIDDQWYVVDPTYNDSESPNSVVLLADATADTLYKEDEWFLVDEDLDKYQATGDDIYEYYRTKGLNVTTSNAASVIINQLQGNSSATVRLPMDTTDAQYDNIGQSVANGLGRSITYYYLNGVMTVYKS